MRAEVSEALRRVGLPREMSERHAGSYSGGCALVKGSRFI